MTPGARLQASMDALDLLWENPAPPNVPLNYYFRTRRYAGAGDRRAISHQIYDILRCRTKIDWWITRSELFLESSPRLFVLVNLVLMESMRLDQIMALFSGAIYCPAPLSHSEKKLATYLFGRDLYHPDMPSSVRFEYPAWMEGSLKVLWEEKFEEEILALNKRAPVDLRVNTLKLTREKAKSILSKASIESEPTLLSPAGLRVIGSKKLVGTEAFKNGFVEIQDEGSQILALLVGARPGMTVIDLCAGAGGKTLALAANMAEQGRLAGYLYACDVSSIRLNRMKARARRAGAFGIKSQIISGAGDKWVIANQNRADRVLIDVPCTGTGVWRRDLNLKWRYQPGDLDNFLKKQQDIMNAASTLVKCGGRLIYATCSILSEENEQQVDWFLSEHQNFIALSMDEVWTESLKNTALKTGVGLRLSPASTATDGFFCAVFKRQN